MTNVILRQTQDDTEQTGARLFYATSNVAKAKEHERILKSLAPTWGISISAIKLRLTEIQSLDVVEVSRHKALEAYKQARQPVLIEDTAWGLTQLQYFPGPLVKWYLDSCKAEGLCRLADLTTDRQVLATVVYSLSLDGTEVLSFRGDTYGRVPNHPQGSHGFGWDPCFIPVGQPKDGQKTFGQMTGGEKDHYSMRRKSLEKLVRRGLNFDALR